MPTPSTTLTTDKLPAGIDWADGLNGNLGTPSPASAVKAKASAGAVSTVNSIPVEELPDSPTIERAEQATVTHSYILPYTEALQKSAVYPRGTLVKDSVENYYRVLSSTVTRMKGNMARFQVVSEALTYDNPPDEFQIVPVELGIDILKHPRYFYALLPSNQIPGFTGDADTDEQKTIKQQIIRLIQVYRENPSTPSDNNSYTQIGDIHEKALYALKALKHVCATQNPNFDPSFPATEVPEIGTTFASNGGKPYPLSPGLLSKDNPPFYWSGYDKSAAIADPHLRVAMASAAALEIIQKIWKMEDTPYVVGYQITWSEYHFRPPPLNPGGYIEDPKTANPPLPDYFGSTKYPPSPANEDSIFYKIASINPQCYSSNGQLGGTTRISWLRKADEIEYQRTWFKVTRTWLGAPIGAWDEQLYSTYGRPIFPTDYVYYNSVTPA